MFSFKMLGIAEVVQIENMKYTGIYFHEKKNLLAETMLNKILSQINPWGSKKNIIP